MVNVSRVFLLYPVAMVARDMLILDVAMVNPFVVFVLTNLLRLENDNLVATIFLEPLTTARIIFGHPVTLSDVGATACMGNKLVTAIVILVENF